MSEQVPPGGPAPLPPGPPTQPEPKVSEGSLLGGIGLAWAIMIGGSLLLGPLSIMLWPVPPLAIMATGVVLIIKGKARTGKGLLLGLASVVAVVVLLAAACFGLLFSSGFHAG